MKATKILSLMLVVMLALCSLAVAGAEGAKRTIVVDGGGDQNNFNSTKTMEKSDANPYPYNELEVLVNEYNAMQSEVEVQLLPESKSTSREAVVALMTANALGVPLVIARRSSKVYEGSAVNINYVSGSSGNIETMSLSRRAVKEGQRALIIDDFLKGGGTAKGMVDLMHEFNVEVVGIGFVMATAHPEKKRIQGEKSLMVMEITQDENPVAKITPADWLKG